jgi:RNA polymerase sigma factor (TIGR02999 family)
MAGDGLSDPGSADEPLPTSHPSDRAGSRESRGDVTQILSAIEQGDKQAPEQLLPLVYNELRKLAADRMSREKPGQTLQATALVHEAYVRLVDGELTQRWDSRGHFFSAAAEAMRRIMVDRARQKSTLKGGGALERVDLDGIPQDLVEPTCEGPDFDLLAVDEALDRLEQIDGRLAELVKLRFFSGLPIPTAAKLLGISTSTAIADWAYARGWLRLELSRE